jgi:hypothetical protein
MTRNVASAVLAASLIALPSITAAFAQSESPNVIAALTGSDRTRLGVLKSIGGWIYYPRYVPARFKLNTVDVQAESRDPAHRDYTLKYCDRAGRCFAIESVGGGVGDVVGKDIRPLTAVSPYFGKFTVWARGLGAETDYLSDWLEDPPMKAVMKNHGTPRRGVIARFHHLSGVGITDREAVMIAESLTPLR